MNMYILENQIMCKCVNEGGQSMEVSVKEARNSKNLDGYFDIRGNSRVNQLWRQFVWSR